MQLQTRLTYALAVPCGTWQAAGKCQPRAGRCQLELYLSCMIVQRKNVPRMCEASLTAAAAAFIESLAFIAVRFTDSDAPPPMAPLRLTTKKRLEEPIVKVAPTAVERMMGPEHARLRDGCSPRRRRELVVHAPTAVEGAAARTAYAKARRWGSDRLESVGAARVVPKDTAISGAGALAHSVVPRVAVVGAGVRLLRLDACDRVLPMQPHGGRRERSLPVVASAVEERSVESAGDR